jgi:altronate hydrolase
VQPQASATQVIRLHAADNVAIVAAPHGLPEGTRIDRADLPQALVLRSAVAFGHKVALQPLAVGAPVLKFGNLIGVATCAIEAGDHVHVHNVDVPPSDGLGLEHKTRVSASAVHADAALPATFRGYLRADGSVGVRNYVVVVSSVNCSATVVKAVCRKFMQRDLSALGVDGVVPVTHASGCAQAIGGQSYEVLNRTLAGWMHHPNVVGAVVIGLGCEGTTFRSILAAKQSLQLTSDIPLRSFGIQEVGGTAAAIERGIAAVDEVLQALPSFERRELPVGALKLALNCGGSDGLSGITANPVLGVVSDLLVERGGTAVLAEIPECHGAEELLYARAASSEVREQLRRTFDWWQDYARRHQVTLNENLAPGNIAGGITTILEKSLGAVAKGGSTPLTQVVGYSQPITVPGFNLMNTPGFDPVSVTGLVAGGTQLVGFTTGRGSVYGCAIAPTLKIATNSEVFRRMPGDMDFDAGRVLATGEVEPIAHELYRLLIETANGKQTCSEALGLGWEEFVPWPVGETL